MIKPSCQWSVASSKLTRSRPIYSPGAPLVECLDPRSPPNPLHTSELSPPPNGLPSPPVTSVYLHQSSITPVHPYNIGYTPVHPYNPRRTQIGLHATLHLLSYTNMKLLAKLVVLSLVASSAAYQQYCKCLCNDVSIVQPIDRCGNCTKQFCLSQDICSSQPTNTSPNDSLEPPIIIINCFQTESFKDSLIVYGFVLLIVGLLVYDQFF